MDKLWEITEGLALGVAWRAWRLVLEPPLEIANISTLRGIWGSALHDVSRELYDRIFEGRWTEKNQVPLYIVRSSLDTTELECVLIGEALKHEDMLFSAWEEAGRRGYGSERIPFSLGSREIIAEGPGALKQAGWRENKPVVLFFVHPVRLLRKGQLIAAPSVRDIALASMRRLWNLQETPPSLDQRETGHALLRLCDQIPTLYDASRPMRYTRYSARQKADVEYRCVSSALAFPEGAGPLMPLFDACQWLHMGKNTIMGLGQPLLEDFNPEELA